MDWYVIRHPETGGVGVVADSALPIHKGAGWVRVSDSIAEAAKDQLLLDGFADAPDLDVPAKTNKTFVKESA